MRLPEPRGAMSEWLVAALRRQPDEVEIPAGVAVGRDVATDEDLQLSLYLCYELHYRGFDEVDEGWEWHPGLLRFRAELEKRLTAWLRATVPVPELTSPVPQALAELVAAEDGPSLAGHLQRRATLAQFREFVIHRSVYHLKEADPHTWAIPRLAGKAKAALVEIQADEYGGGRPERMHATLFAATMRELDLDDEYGAYVDDVPALTLATSNVMSMFGLHRSWRGAIAGHLAALEMTSSLPNRRYGNGLRRLGGGPAATRFFDEHVAADAVHEQVAAHDLCGALVADEPRLGPDVLFGAACALALDRLFAEHVLSRWSAGRSSLRGTSTVAQPA